MQPVIDPYANISAAPNTDGDIPIADQDDLFRGEQVDFLLVIAGGTSATDTLLEIRALAADDGLEIPAIAIDSLHQLPVPVYSRSGKRVGIHPTEFFKLGLGGGRTEWAKLEVTKAFYLGRFKGFSMHESQYTAGNGSHSSREIANFDYAGDSERVVRKLRRVLRRIKHSRTSGHIRGWGRHLQPRMDEAPIRILCAVLGSTVGAVGSDGLIWIPYLLQIAAEAEAVQVEPYAFAFGPSPFLHLHDRVLQNHASTLCDLRHVTENGFELMLTDGLVAPCSSGTVQAHLPPRRRSW